MQWAKAKTIMIWLFLAVDIILAVIWAAENISSKKSDRENLTAVLKNNNIIVRSELLDTKKKNVYASELTGLALDQKTASVFLDNPVKTDDFTFENGAKTARLYASSGRILYENSAPDFPKFSNVSEKNVSSLLKPYLKTLGVEKYVRINRTYEKNGDIFAEYSYFFDNRELYQSNIIFAVNKNGIKSISGDINIPNGDEGYNFTLSGIETVLMNFAQNNKFAKEENIVSINLGYYRIGYENILVSQAIPVYRIKTTDKMYIYDARDGIDARTRQLWSE